MGAENAVDVLIVGAGPTGLVAALRLAELGVSFDIVDKAQAPATESRAALMHASTVEILAALGMGDALLTNGQRIDAITIADGSRVLARVPFAGLRSPFPFALGIPQDVTEHLLTLRLESFGCRLSRGVEVNAVAQDADGCLVSGVEASTGAPWSRRCRYVIGADGKNSTGRAVAGIPFPGGAYEDDFILADVALDPAPAPADEARITFSPLGVTVIGRLPSGRHRIIATARADRETPRMPDRGYLDELLSQRGIATATADDPAWSSRFRIGHQLAERFRDGRIFLCGDSAHVHSPAAGQGMNTGIADAYDLASGIAAAFGPGDNALLDSYENTRRRAARDVIRLTDRLTRAALLRPRAARTMRNTAIRALTRVPVVRATLASWVSGITRSPLHERAHDSRSA